MIIVGQVYSIEEAKEIEKIAENVIVALRIKSLVKGELLGEIEIIER